MTVETVDASELRAGDYIVTGDEAGRGYRLAGVAIISGPIVDLVQLSSCATPSGPARTFSVLSTTKFRRRPDLAGDPRDAGNTAPPRAKPAHPCGGPVPETE
jgi:hypothetical protein